MIKKWTFDRILTISGWSYNHEVYTDSEGQIVEAVSNPDVSETVNGTALPPFMNAHSHAFQYAMIGLAESSKGHTNDSFWSWRRSMYDIALKINPEDLESIATMLYHDMLLNGYSHVAEFHYLHKDKDGSLYMDPAETSKRLASAAKRAGIHLTIIPILYQKSGFGKPPNDSQRRFTLTNEEYSDLMHDISDFADHALGFHSLRAVDITTIGEFASSYKGSAIHIHISEQLKEVSECFAATGMRPLEYLHKNIGLDQRWNLVHGTHINDHELTTISNAGSTVVICPSTEGNLGDGVFPIREFLGRGGKWSFGTDSHIGLDPFEELRLLDYSNRMRSHMRLSFSDITIEDVILSIHKNGRVGMGIGHSFLEQGSSLDVIVIDDDHPLFETEQYLSTLVYHFNAGLISKIMIDGHWVVKDRNHPQTAIIREAFARTIRSLKLR